MQYIGSLFVTISDNIYLFNLSKNIISRLLFYYSGFLFISAENLKWDLIILSIVICKLSSIS